MYRYDPYIDPILGVVRRCPTCNEVWPEGDEWYRDPRKGPCHACLWEMAERRRAIVRAAVRAYRAKLRQDGRAAAAAERDRERNRRNARAYRARLRAAS